MSENNTPRAVDSGILHLGNVEIPCYVLNDETRLISQRGLQKALGMSSGGGSGGERRIISLITSVEEKWRKQADLRARKNEESKAKKAENDEKLRKHAVLGARLSAPILFHQLPKGGTVGYGYEATILADICSLLIDCREEDVLSGPQLKYAVASEKLLTYFAKVGIIALVDEATGHQYKRDKNALQEILKAYIRPEFLPWVKTFPDEFYQLMFQLKGWQYNHLSVKRPILVGKITDNIVYRRFPEGVLEKLKEMNPKDANGRRLNKHHLLLTSEIGRPHLEKHLASLITLERLAVGSGAQGGPGMWRKFMSMVERVFPIQRGQLSLNLHAQGEEGEEDLDEI
jgi:hypothetical protein